MQSANNQEKKNNISIFQSHLRCQGDDPQKRKDMGLKIADGTRSVIIRRTDRSTISVRHPKLKQQPAVLFPRDFEDRLIDHVESLCLSMKKAQVWITASASDTNFIQHDQPFCFSFVTEAIKEFLEFTDNFQQYTPPFIGSPAQGKDHVTDHFFVEYLRRTYPNKADLWAALQVEWERNEALGIGIGRTAEFIKSHFSKAIHASSNTDSERIRKLVSGEQFVPPIPSRADLEEHFVRIMRNRHSRAAFAAIPTNPMSYDTNLFLEYKDVTWLIIRHLLRETGGLKDVWAFLRTCTAARSMIASQSGDKRWEAVCRASFKGRYLPRDLKSTFRWFDVFEYNTYKPKRQDEFFPKSLREYVENKHGLSDLPRDEGRLLETMDRAK